MATMLFPGDQAPWFHAPALEGNPRYAFDTAAGRPILMLLLGSAKPAVGAAAVATVAAQRAYFDDARASFFGVTSDPADAAEGRIAPALPGMRWFLDYDGAVARQYGAIEEAKGRTSYRPHWLVLDRAMRVVSRHPIEAGEQALAALRAHVDAEEALPTAPVLVVPRVFEPELCRRLIDLYEANGGEDSGFMREENGITVGRIDHSHKRRSDYHIEDEELRGQLRARLKRFLIPQITRALMFEPTRIERWLVACYDGGDKDGRGGGHFRAHRDNTTKGTAHRKFAVTINLNAEEYEGGELAFPEFGPRSYRAPTGGAVVFSCSLLHEAQPVRRGKRYAFLPFLYDEAGAAVREANMQFVSPDIQGYRANPAAAEQAA